MTIKGGSLCAVEFPAMVGVIEHPDKGFFLFDTGYDPTFIQETQTFPEKLYRWTTPVSIGSDLEWRTWLSAHRIDPSCIAGTIISHFHGDHVAGLHHLTGRPIYCARAGLHKLRSGSRFSRVRNGLLTGLVPESFDADAHFFEDQSETLLPSAFAPFTCARDILGDKSLLAVELPGHCAGHWGLALRLEDDRFLLLAADAVWSIEAVINNRPPPRITTALLGNTRIYRKTLSQLHMAHDNCGELTILPSHCSKSAAWFQSDDAI